MEKFQDLNADKMLNVSIQFPEYVKYQMWCLYYIYLIYRIANHEINAYGQKLKEREKQPKILRLQKQSTQFRQTCT